MSSKLVYGVGVSEDGEFARSYMDCGKSTDTKEYMLWVNMLMRCYSKAYQESHPAYIGCSVSDNFKNFQYFAKWCNEQHWFGCDGHQLDKDILLKGNKIYCEELCVFVPRTVNKLLTHGRSNRGLCPVGVCYHKASGKFNARLNVGGLNKYIGCYTTPEQAFQAYKQAKEAAITRTAEEYRDKMDSRVYEALLVYVVTDKEG